MRATDLEAERAGWRKSEQAGERGRGQMVWGEKELAGEGASALDELTKPTG